MTNKIIYDAKGRPDIMVAFTPEELGLPATLRGRPVKEYMIAKYPFTLIEGVPYSLPFQQPATGIDFDTAVRLCESKGPGWHLITNDEWAALARQSLANGTLPRGNTCNGSSHSHPEESGIKFAGGYGKTLTGSGPATWSHDHTPEGVMDLTGNVWEWVGGVRFLNGQLQVIPDNGAAAGADQSRRSPEWTPICTPDGDAIHYIVEGGEIRLSTTPPEDTDWDGTRFADLDGDQIDVPDKLIELGLYPSADFTGDDFFWLDTDGERLAFRGGSWSYGAIYGVFSFSGLDARSCALDSIGGRSAFVCFSDICDLDHLTPDHTGEEAEA